MNKNMKTFAIIIAALFIGGGSLALGALTAPQQQPQAQIERQAPAPQASQTPTPQPQPVVDPLESARATVTTLLVSAYPKSGTDYTMNGSKLDSSKQWFTAILTYKGADTMNRDTLRVLAQKKDGEWTLRTTPPEIILSAKKYRDVPKEVLESVNKPVSLPGTDTSPTINPAG